MGYSAKGGCLMTCYCQTVAWDGDFPLPSSIGVKVGLSHPKPIVYASSHRTRLFLRGDR